MPKRQNPCRGEEFVALAAECTVTAALDLAERFRQSVCAAPIEATGATITVTMSLGVAATAAAQDGEALLKASDEALDRAEARRA